MKITEKQIEVSILHYLKLKGIFAWKNDTTGIYSEKRGAFIKRHSKYHMTGQSDILGIFLGRFLAIEVKKPGNYPTANQREFMESVRKHGGIAFVARSIKDVEESLKLWSTQ